MSAAGWKRSFRLEENGRHVSRNVDEEIHFHIESRLEQLVAEGMSESEARRMAEEEFGGIEQTRSELEKIGGWRLRFRSIGLIVAAIALDTRFAVRSYIKRPVFALTAILIIGLGVGASTTIFSVVDAVLIERLPYPEADRLIYFDNASHPVPTYRDWEARSTVFSSMGAITREGLDYTGGGSPERLRSFYTTAEILPMLDARILHGRLFSPDDFLGAPRVAVLSHDVWQRIFSSDPAIVGETITLSDMSLVVVGILAEEFRSPYELMGERSDVWLPLDITDPEIQSPTSYILEVVARLKPGVSFSQAQGEMNTLAISLAEEYPDRFQQEDGSPAPITLVSLQDALTGPIATPLLLLLGAVGLLLAIACANVANLFLARGTDRVHDVGLRYAIGASRRRMMAQLLTESTVISLAGGTLGIILAIFGVRLFEALNPGGIPLSDRIGVDLRVLGFALGVSLLTGFLFGLVPALRARRFDVNSALRDASRRASGNRTRARLRNSLLVSEIAFSLVLLATAGQLMKSFIMLQAVDPGFDSDNIAVIPLRFDTDAWSEDTRVLMTGRILERLESVPGALKVGAATTIPFLYYSGGISGAFNSGFVNDQGVEIDEFTCLNPVTDGYFDLLGAELRGREHEAGDEIGDPVPVVISGLLAGSLYPDEEAIGRTFTNIDGNMSFRIVGVVSAAVGPIRGRRIPMFHPRQDRRRPGRSAAGAQGCRLGGISRPADHRDLYHEWPDRRVLQRAEVLSRHPALFRPGGNPSGGRGYLRLHPLQCGTATAGTGDPGSARGRAEGTGHDGAPSGRDGNPHRDDHRCHPRVGGHLRAGGDGLRHIEPRSANLPDRGGPAGDGCHDRLVRARPPGGPGRSGGRSEAAVGLAGHQREDLRNITSPETYP